MTTDEYQNSSRAKVIVYHEDEDKLRSIKEWTDRYHWTGETFWEDHYEYHNDAPLELEVIFEREEDAREWRSIWTGKHNTGATFSLRHEKHDRLTVEQYEHKLEREHRHANVYGPWLDNIKTETYEMQQLFMKFLMRNVKSIRERREELSR